MSEQKEESDAETGGYSLKTYLIATAAIGTIPIVIIFVIGLVLALTGEPTIRAERVAVVRDATIIIVFFELFLIVVVLVGLTIQITRLVGTVQGELQPMIANTREATETVKGTTKFMSRNLAEPIISFWAVLAGVLALARELGRIRKVVRRQADSKN